MERASLRGMSIGTNAALALAGTLLPSPAADAARPPNKVISRASGR